MDDTYGRILNIARDPLFRKEVTAYLEDNGFSTDEVSYPPEALFVLKEKKPDLILSDLCLPLVSDGLALLDTLTKESPETPVIIISSEDMHVAIKALRMGASDYITKPIQNMAVLEHAVCRALERGRLLVENKKYRKALEEKNHQLTLSLTQLKEDQKAGKSVQEQLLPQSFLEYQKVAFSYKVFPSLYLSGDCIDYFKIDRNKIGFYIADVSGHGASSAFVTVLLKSWIGQMRDNYQMGYNDSICHPESVLQQMNNEIFHAKLGKYITMIYGILDYTENSLSYSIGGHYPSPILYDGKKAHFLRGKGFAVGIKEALTFSTQTIGLPSQFSMGFFSDGVFEIIQGKNLAEKEAKLLHYFDHLKKNISIQNIVEHLGLKEEVHFPDDVTILLINKNK